MIDGTGAPWYRTDVAISGDRIEEIKVGLPVSGADTVIDAKELVVSPGFKADITVFDPLNVRERATYFDPKHSSPRG